VTRVHRETANAVRIEERFMGSKSMTSRTHV